MDFIDALALIGIDSVVIPLSHAIVCYITYKITKNHGDETLRRVLKYERNKDEL